MHENFTYGDIVISLLESENLYGRSNGAIYICLKAKIHQRYEDDRHLVMLYAFNDTIFEKPISNIISSSHRFALYQRMQKILRGDALSHWARFSDEGIIVANIMNPGPQLTPYFIKVKSLDELHTYFYNCMKTPFNLDYIQKYEDTLEELKHHRLLSSLQGIKPKFNSYPSIDPPIL